MNNEYTKYENWTKLLRHSVSPDEVLDSVEHGKAGVNHVVHHHHSLARHVTRDDVLRVDPCGQNCYIDYYKTKRRPLTEKP